MMASGCPDGGPAWNAGFSRHAGPQARRRVGLHALMAERLGTPVSRPARAVLRTAHVATLICAGVRTSRYTPYR